MLVNAVSLSLTTISDLQRRAMIASSPSATLLFYSYVSATTQGHSRVQSTTTARMRNCRPLSVSVSNSKPKDQRWFGCCGNVIDDRVPNADLRPPRRRTCPRSRAYICSRFLWLIRMPSRFSSTCSSR